MENREIKFLKLQQIIDAHEGKVSHLIAILQETQAEYGYLPKEALTYIATAMGISPATVLGVATFYAQFSLIPKGKYVIRVCDGTACHVRGSEPIMMALRKELSLTPDNPTTSDLMFTVETVSCLGACGLAPVVVADEEVHGQMTPDGIVEIVRKLAKSNSEN
ncbi:NADH-quinone oxidoreductase subunit NuoE [Desulfotomaculum varum]|uniref:NADH dehydrogenase (Ubiquinone) 24 kDa subunit n=1 Tax=Desulforamulus hydrothermalis Lam5 = DSM 18033 TaxID=1121428 RepID=K8DXH7_9FIRM|nr:NAD(P)H-dependent oxidoreductase subunit E [Desulforamulus hydrothermalis]CCO07235.1 NADH dehydrogenase (Ubiquinone) 24 kDa subunit [Desulforamulus hydrothermalis Lam5 = DSM 18033]SHG87420.1 NADH-quinone oxidoreductase subunit E [Desulforamulus hydrothermalis Lam5 = DSM 18033]